MKRPPTDARSDDPGVPEALPRALIRLRERLGVQSIDRLWIFDPVRKGRREQGLVTVSTFLEGSDRRCLTTVAYTAEHTGSGVTLDVSFSEAGEAPPDRFPGVMEGVVRRGGDEEGEAREVEIAASAAEFEALLEEFDALFLEARGA